MIVMIFYIYRLIVIYDRIFESFRMPLILVRIN